MSSFVNPAKPKALWFVFLEIAAVRLKYGFYSFNSQRAAHRGVAFKNCLKMLFFIYFVNLNKANCIFLQKSKNADGTKL